MRPAFLLLISAIIIIIRADARFGNVATPSHFPHLVFPVVVRNPSGKKMKPWSDVSDEPPPTEAKPQTTTTKETTTAAPSTTPETTATTTVATTTTGKASACSTQPTCPNMGGSANTGCASTRFPLPLQCCSVPVNPRLYVARYTRTAFVLAVAQNLDTQLSHKFEHYLAEALALCTPSEDEIVKSIRVVLGLVQGDLLSGSIDFIEEFVVMAKLKQRSSHGKNAAARSIATHKGMVEITSALMAALKGNVRTSNILNTLLHVSHEFVDVSAEGAGSVVLAALLAMRRTHTGETGDCITQRFGHAAPIAQLLMVFFAASDLQEGPFSDSFQAVYDGSIAKWSRMERTAVRADSLDTYGDVIENKSPKLRTDVNTIKRTNDAGFWSRRVLHRRRNSRPLMASTDPPERSIADVELFDAKT